MVRRQNGLQNLTIDYSTDTNGRILSADYNKTGGSTVRIVPVYDNYGNIIAWKLDYGDMAKVVLINPNNGAIDTRDMTQMILMTHSPIGQEMDFLE